LGANSRAVLCRNHPPGCLLDHKKPAKTRNLDRLARGFGIDLGDRAVRPRAGVVEHHIGRSEARLRLLEQVRDGRRIHGINREPFRADFAGKRCQFFDVARRQSDLNAGRGQAAGDGCADAGTRPNDQGGTVWDGCHDGLLLLTSKVKASVGCYGFNSAPQRARSACRNCARRASR
jgi:hypothetical protein